MTTAVAWKLVHDYDPIEDVRGEESLGHTPSAGSDRIHDDLERLYRLVVELGLEVERQELILPSAWMVAVLCVVKFGVRRR